jgi:voltage-gated potassium channel
VNTFKIIQTIFKPLIWPLFALFLVTLFGVIGFISIERFSFGDALYMTVITESTVGFTEVHTLSGEGRYFTIVLIILSFGVFAFAVTSITSYISGGEYKKNIFKMKHDQLMNNLENHSIVCGYGRVGRKAIDELSKQNKSFVIIENNQKLVDEPNLVMIIGDATMDETLLKAGIKKAANIIVALPSDSDNLMIIVTAHALNPRINIVARVSNKVNESKLKNAGANHIISPDSVGGIAMARMVTKPDLMEFMDRMTNADFEDISLDEIDYNDSSGKKLSIKDFDKEKLAGCNIIGYKTIQGEFIINPSLDTIIESNTKLFVIGNKEQIRKLHINLS